MSDGSIDHAFPPNEIEADTVVSHAELPCEGKGEVVSSRNTLMQKLTKCEEALHVPGQRLRAGNRSVEVLHTLGRTSNERCTGVNDTDGLVSGGNFDGLSIDVKFYSECK